MNLPREVEQLTTLDEGQRSNLIINVDIWQQLNPELKNRSRLFI